MKIFFCYSLILFVFSPLSFSGVNMEKLVAEVVNEFCSILSREGWTPISIISDKEIERRYKGAARLIKHEIKAEDRKGYLDIEFGPNVSVQTMKKALDKHEINSEHVEAMRPYLEGLHPVKDSGSMLGLAMVFMHYVDEPSDDISHFAEALARSTLQAQHNYTGWGNRTSTPSGMLKCLNEHLRDFGLVEEYNIKELSPKVVDYLGKVKKK